MFISLSSYNILAQAYIRYTKANGIFDTYCELAARKNRLMNYFHTQLESETLVLGFQEVEPEMYTDLCVCFSTYQSLYTQRKNSVDGLALFLHPDIKVQSSEVVILHSVDGQPRRLTQIMDIEHQGSDWRLVHLHLDYDPIGRTDGFHQMATVLEYLSQMSSRTTLIFGDFNATVDSTTIQSCLSKSFQIVDTRQPTSFHRQWSRVDHVLYSSECMVDTLKIPDIPDSIPNAVWGSDHLPIYCRFSLL